MLKDYQRSNEVVFAEEAIWVSSQRSVKDLTAAQAIAETFAETERVYIPYGTNDMWPFLQMLGAVWTGGYIAGVRAAKEKFRRGMEFVPAEITAKKAANRLSELRIVSELLQGMDDTSNNAAAAMLKTMVSGGSNEEAVAACNTVLASAGRKPIVIAGVCE